MLTHKLHLTSPLLPLIDRLLPEKAAAVKPRDWANQVPLQRAASTGSIPFVHLILQSKSPNKPEKPRLNLLDRAGNTLLHLAIESGHAELAVVLIEGGADRERGDSDGFRPEEIEGVGGTEARKVREYIFSNCGPGTANPIPSLRRALTSHCIPRRTPFPNGFVVNSSLSLSSPSSSSFTSVRITRLTVYTSPWPAVPLPEVSVWDHVWSNPKQREDDAVAVVDGLTGETLTRLELRLLSQRLAYGLIRRAGLSKGDVVCLFSPNTLHYPAIVFATQCAGLIFSGANAAYTPGELKHQVEDSGAKLLLVHPALLETALSATKALGWSRSEQDDRIILAVKQDQAGAATSRFMTLDDLISNQLLEPVKVEKPKEAVGYLTYSSGTSGKAKGVQTSAFNMTSVMNMLAPLEFHGSDTLVVFLPFSHILGLSNLLHYPVIQGVPIIVLPKFTLDSLCSTIEKHRISILMLVPPVALLLARHPEVKKYDLSSLRQIFSGAAPLGAELEKELGQKFPQAIVGQSYGLTETSPSVHIGINSPPGSVGPLLPMMQARLVDPETGKDVSRGEAGELWLAGPNVMLGYLNRPEANAETLVQDPQHPGITWLKTGDIAYVDEKDNFYISDRLKELIKVKGFQVPPAELEAALLECPLVADCAVIGVWNENEATEYPRGFVVLSAEGKKEKDPVAAIHAWTKGKVAHYKQLRGGIKLVDLIPKSPSGKILRRILRDEVKKEGAEKARQEAATMEARL